MTECTKVAVGGRASLALALIGMVVFLLGLVARPFRPAILTNKGEIADAGELSNAPFAIALAHVLDEYGEPHLRIRSVLLVGRGLDNQADLRAKYTLQAVALACKMWPGYKLPEGIELAGRDEFFPFDPTEEVGENTSSLRRRGNGRDEAPGDGGVPGIPPGD